MMAFWIPQSGMIVGIAPQVTPDEPPAPLVPPTPQAIFVHIATPDVVHEQELQPSPELNELPTG